MRDGPSVRSTEKRAPALSAVLWQRSGLDRIGANRVARGLGWFSIGLGIAELLMPRAVARLAGGSGRHTGLIRLYGLREIATGLLIFSQGKRPASGVWTRVGGDAMDLATLGAAALLPGTNKTGVAFAAANVLGVTAVDMLCAQELSRQQGSITEHGAIRIRRSIAVNRPAQELYEFWHDLENLPSFMYHLESVHVVDGKRSHWVARGPGGTHIEWDAEITVDRPYEYIGWKSLPGADVENAGSIRFEPRPDGRGTTVRVKLEYWPPGGMIGDAFAKLFNESPAQQLYDDLRRFKQIVETGEVLRSNGSPQGTGQVMQRPARPEAA